MKKIDVTSQPIEIGSYSHSINYNPEEILTLLDSTLVNIDSLLKKMQETGSMVKRARNSTFKHI